MTKTKRLEVLAGSRVLATAIPGNGRLSLYELLLPSCRDHEFVCRPMESNTDMEEMAQFRPCRAVRGEPVLLVAALRFAAPQLADWLRAA